MKAAVLGVAMAMMLPAQSFALTVLCVESRGAGFNWRNGAWTAATFTGRQHLVKDVGTDIVLAPFCTATDPVKGEYGTRSKMCFNIAEVGEAPDVMGSAECDVSHADDGTIKTVSCSSLWTDWSFIPNGEFQLTQLHSYVQASPPAERDSLAVFVGKCSVVAP